MGVHMRVCSLSGLPQRVSSGSYSTMWSSFGEVWVLFVEGEDGTMRRFVTVWWLNSIQLSNLTCVCDACDADQCVFRIALISFL